MKITYRGIKADLARRGMTQTELANKLDIHYNTVGNWLNGVTSPDMENVIAMMLAMGYDLDEVLAKPIGDLINIEE